MKIQEVITTGNLSVWNLEGIYYFMEKMVADKIDFDVYHGVLTKELLDELHAKGIVVNCWTVDDPHRAEELAAWGVDYITSNILE